MADPRGATPIYISGNGPYFLDDIDSLDTQTPVTSMMMEPGRRKNDIPTIQRKDSSENQIVEEKLPEVTPKADEISSVTEEVSANTSKQESDPDMEENNTNESAVPMKEKDTLYIDTTQKNNDIRTSPENSIKPDIQNQSSPLTIQEEKTEVPKTEKVNDTVTATIVNPANSTSNRRDENLLQLPEILNAPIFEIHEEALEKKNVVVYNDIEYPKNTVFSIQIGAFRNPISQEFYDNFSPVITENLNDDLKRYTVGLFNTLYQAKNALRKIKLMGYSDAFIIVHDNGKRMTLQQWRNL